MLSHEELKRHALADIEVKAEYDKLAPEFAFLEQVLASQMRSPSLAMLRKYADAVGCELQVRFVPRG